MAEWMNIWPRPSLARARRRLPWPWRDSPTSSPLRPDTKSIRQRRRNLSLIRMTPDLIYDQLIGAGCATQLTFSWGGNPGVGSLHRFRDAVENGWPARWRLRNGATAIWPMPM